MKHLVCFIYFICSLFPTNSVTNYNKLEYMIIYFYADMRICSLLQPTEKLICKYLFLCKYVIVVYFNFFSSIVYVAFYAKLCSIMDISYARERAIP